MRAGVRRALRVVGMCSGGFLYLMSGVPSCAGHAGYFRERFMRDAECTGTTLDLAACAVAVTMIWLAVLPSRPRSGGAWERTATVLAFGLVLIAMAAVMLYIPAIAAVVNCASRR